MQNDTMIQVQVDETEDTEWNDILRQHGVIPERPPSPTAQLEEALEEALAKQEEKKLEGKNLSDLEDLEDTIDEDFLEFYKKKRIAEIQELQNLARFGQVYHISKPEYNKEITECSMGKSQIKPQSNLFNENNGNSDDKGVYVFVHLSSQGKLQSRLLSNIFQQAAPKFPQIKFVEIPGNRAIENYPETNCPTLIVYYKGDVLKNLVTLLELGGNTSTLDNLERLMVKIGAVSEDDNRLIMNQEDFDRENEHLHVSRKTIRNGVSGKFNLRINNKSDDDDDDFFY